MREPVKIVSDERADGAGGIAAQGEPPAGTGLSGADETTGGAACVLGNRAQQVRQVFKGSRQAPEQAGRVALEGSGLLASGAAALMAAPVANECFEGGITGWQARDAIAMEEIGAPIGEQVETLEGKVMGQGTSWSSRAPLQDEAMQMAAQVWSDRRWRRISREQVIGLGQEVGDLLQALLAGTQAGGQSLGVRQGGLTRPQVGGQGCFAVRRQLRSQGGNELRQLVIAPQPAEAQGRATGASEAIQKGLLEAPQPGWLWRRVLLPPPRLSGRLQPGQWRRLQRPCQVGAARRVQLSGRGLKRGQLRGQRRAQLQIANLF